MTIKERFNIRIERIKKYKEYVAEYRDAKQKLEQAEKDITDLVDADKVENTFACIKKYITTAPATNTYDIGENVFLHTAYCHRFHNNPCLIFNCPFYEKHKLYKHYQLLLDQTQKIKHAAYRAIFERIK